MSSRTVFIADPQPPFRAGLRGALEQAGLEVVGEADDRGGLVAVRRITRDPAGPSVLVLATTPSPDGLLAALRAGASGYLPRSTPGNGLVRAIESVLDGSFAVTRASVAAL